jgi:hypothetical protein
MGYAWGYNGGNKKCIQETPKIDFCIEYQGEGPPLWSSGQSSWLEIQRSGVRFRALPDFLRSSGSVTGSTQPRDDK